MSYPLKQRTSLSGTVTPIKSKPGAVQLLRNKLMEEGMGFTPSTLDPVLAVPTVPAAAVGLLPTTFPTPSPGGVTGGSFGGWTMSQVNRDIANQHNITFAN